MTYDFSELKRVQFSDLIALQIPARWNVDARPDLDWFCTEGDEESGSLTVAISVLQQPKGAPDPDLKNQMEDMIAHAPLSPGNRAPLESALSEFRYGYLYKYVCDFDDEDGIVLRTYRYTFLQFHGGVLALIILAVVIVQTDAERSDMRELIAIMERSAQEIDLLLYKNRRATLPDLGELQTIYCGKALSLRVPARWDLWTNTQEDEGWSCYRKGEESGTLWITINRFQRPTQEEDPKFSPRAYLDHMVSNRLRNRDIPAFDSRVSEVKSGYLWSYDFSTEENGDDLHYFRYVFLVADKTEVAIATISFVILSAQLEDRNIRGLVGLIDREVRATNLSILSGAARAEGSVPFPFPQAFGFDQKVHINLPGSIKISPQGEDHGIYCSFPPNITASMWIQISDHKLSDNPFEDDGFVAPDVFQSLELHFADDIHEETVITRYPRGFVVHSMYDDEDRTADQIDDPAQRWKRFGFRNHLWRHFYIGSEIVREVRFLLMLPIREPNKRVLKSLVRILEREICQAQFPGM